MTHKKKKISEFKFDGGIIEFVEFLDQKEKNCRIKMEMTYSPIYIEGNKTNIEIECSLKWNSSYTEDVFSYTNNIFKKMAVHIY